MWKRGKNLDLTRRFNTFENLSMFKELVFIIKKKKIEIISDLHVLNIFVNVRSTSLGIRVIIIESSFLKWSLASLFLLQLLIHILLLSPNIQGRILLKWYGLVD